MHILLVNSNLSATFYCLDMPFSAGVQCYVCHSLLLEFLVLLVNSPLTLVLGFYNNIVLDLYILLNFRTYELRVHNIILNPKVTLHGFWIYRFGGKIPKQSSLFSSTRCKRGSKSSESEMLVLLEDLVLYFKSYYIISRYSSFVFVVAKSALAWGFGPKTCFVLVRLMVSLVHNHVC